MHQRVVMTLVMFAALGHFNRVGISVAGSEIFIARYGLSAVSMGWIYTAFLLSYTLAMLPGGWLIDRLGSVRAMTLYGVCMGICVVCTGGLGLLGLSVSGLWLSLMVARSITGVCSVPLHPGAAHAISEFVPVSLRAAANGFVTAGALVGIALCYPVYGWMNDHWGWPASFAVGGGLLLLVGLGWKWMMGRVDGDSVSVAGTVGREASTNYAWLGNHNIWLITISYAAYGYFQYLFFYWMEYYFSQELHVEVPHARMLTAVVMLSQGAGMAVGGYGTGLLCQRIGISRGRRSIVIAGMGLGALFGVIGVNVSGLQTVVTCLSLAMAAQGICEGVFWTAITDVGRADRGKSAAFMNTGGNLGGLISPVIAPMMAKSFGWPTSIAVACVVIALGGLLWLRINPDDNSTGDRPDAT